MLANLLAIVVGLGSGAFYLAAFILPEVHRRSDFFWSGVGMFYAVVLWYCARQINGAVLLGQTASVGLLLWLGYQTLLLRRKTTPAAQQTPVLLGKSDRDRTPLRPIAKDYEFVEDGVEEAVDQEPDPNSPILIKPAADEFALKMVVPAAMASDNHQQSNPEKPPVSEASAPETTPKREKPNPLAAMGIFVGWLKDVVTPQKQPPKPMIELPPRPPSIPKPDTTEIAATLDSVPSQTNQPEAVTAQTSPASSQKTVVPAEPVATDAAVPAAQQDDEDSNWPDDEFWD